MKRDEIDNAKAHLEAAAKALLLKAYRSTDGKSWDSVDHFTIAEDLHRIDRCIGPKGESIFAMIADNIIDAYTEILAARACLDRETQ